MTQFKIAAHGCTAQIEVAEFHTEIVAAVGIVLDGEGWTFRRIEHAELRGDNLDIAGGKVRIFACAFSHTAFHLHHIFAAEMTCNIAERCVGIIVEYNLSDSISVAEVDESHAAHSAHALHPAGQRDALSRIGETQLAASVGSIHSLIYEKLY